MKSFINFVKGIVLKGEATDPTDNTPGSIWQNSTTGRIKAYVESAVRELVSTDQTQTLTNKSIDGGTNTLTNIPASAISSVNRSSITAGNPNEVVIDDGSGLLSSEAHLAKSRGGTGVDNSAVTFPSTGVIVTEAGTETLTNKTLTAPAISTILNGTGTLTLPANTNDTLVGENTTDTLTNKTLTAPVINSPTGIVKGDVGLGNVDNTSDATKNAASATLTNKKLDDTTTSIVDTADNTKTIKFDAGGTTATGTTITAAQTANRVLTLPNATDTLAGISASQTLSNKQIDDTNVIVVKAPNLTIEDNSDPTKTVKFQTTSVPSGGVNQQIPAVSGTLLNDSNTVTVSNKTFQEPKVLLGVDYEIQSALTNTVPAGYKRLYPKTDGKFYQLDSSGTETLIGGSAAGGINYVLNPDAETSTSGWAAYQNTAQSTPVSGTGGTPNVTFTRSTSSPLRGIASFLFTKDAANRQGQGASYTMTIDSADQGKVLQISADYQIASGTYADGDLGVYVYDITNSQLIVPSVSNINNSTLNAKVNVTFQTNTNSTSYRLIFHVQSTSALAYTVKLDNVIVGPQLYSFGPAMTDFVSYIPTLTTSAWGTSPNIFKSQWRRVGDSVEIQGLIQFGTGSLTTNTYIPLPLGLTIDSTKMTTPPTYTVVGSVNQDNQSASVMPIASGGDVGFYMGYFSSSSTASVPQIVGVNGHYLGFSVKIPIQGWSSGQALSSDVGNNRIIAISTPSQVPTGTISGTPSIAKFATITKDTHNAYNISTGLYTVPSSGWFQVNSTIEISGTSTSNDQFARVDLYKNGSATGVNGAQVTSAGVVINLTPTMSGTIYCNAGDTLGIYASSNIATSPIYGSGLTQSSFSIVRVNSGNQQISATEKIAVEYCSSAGQSIPNVTTTPIAFGTKITDTHGAFSGTTFTAPATGTYLVIAKVALANSSASPLTMVPVLIGNTKTSTGIRVSFAAGATRGSDEVGATCTDTFVMKAGDTVYFALYSDNGAARNLGADPTENTFSAIRIGV